jgi:chromosome segregation ATPase
MKPVILVLVVACLGLTAALVVVRQKTEARVQTAEARTIRATTELEETRIRFTDLEKLYSVQESTLNKRAEELALASNNLAAANVNLTTANDQLAKLTGDLKSMQAEMLKRQERIAALETQRDDLTKKMEDLTTSIEGLEGQIADTKRKLATSEGDKNFLAAELKRLQSDKDNLVRQFNSLAALRVQVAKLKEEAAIKQRLEWKRIGVYANQERKGAERLFASTFVPAAPQSRLDADLYQGGQVAPASTNSVTGRASSVEPAVTAP